MKNIYRRMMNYKLHTRLMLCFSTMVIVSIVLVGAVAYAGSYQIVENLAYSFSKQSAESVADNLNDVFNEAENLTNLVENYSIFQNILTMPYPENMKERYSIELQYDYELYQLTGYTVNEYGGFYILGNNGLNFKSHSLSFQNKDFREEDWYKEIINRDQAVWLGPQYYSRVSKSIDRRYAAMGCPIINKANGEKMGIVLVEIDAGTIDYILDEYGNVENGVIQILDGENNILFQKTAEGNITEKAFFKSNTDKNKDDSVFYYTETMDNGWTVESYIPKQILLGSILNLGMWLAAVIAGMIFLAVLITNIIAKTVTDPIHKLIELMEEAEHQGFDVKMHVKYKDELSVLGNKFNDMMLFTRRLIAVNNQEQENLREAELRTLQMQINPHFLYNTLETVIWLIRSGDCQKAINVITSLSKFFRIGLSRGKNVITLKEELEHVQEYVNIQNTRYRDKIHFFIDVEDDEIKNLILPKLVLQPLVENAIYHGIQEKPEGGSIGVIIGYKNENEVYIAVVDSGIGMTDIQLDSLRRGIETKEGAGYGMYNTSQRLCKYFGKQSVLQVDSQFGIGTKVEFCVPFSEERREVNV